jgi:hypothetical protein
VGCEGNEEFGSPAIRSTEVGPGRAAGIAAEDGSHPPELVVVALHLAAIHVDLVPYL